MEQRRAVLPIQARVRGWYVRRTLEARRMMALLAREQRTVRASCRREERAIRDMQWSFVDAEAKLRKVDPRAAEATDAYDGTRVERALLRRVRSLQVFSVRVVLDLLPVYPSGWTAAVAQLEAMGEELVGVAV